MNSGMTIGRRSALVLLLLFSQAAAPVVVESLHRAVVAVEDHSRGQLTSATRQALGQVLVKVSGDRSVLEYDVLRSALAQADGYVQRYQYLRSDDGSLKLQVHFDPRLVNELLREAQAPLWTANRPSLLVWLVAEDAGGRQPVTREARPELIDALAEQLERRGVPVVFPLYDLQDTLALSVEDLWRLDEIAVSRASQRYGVADVLVGRLTELSADRWMGDWLYLYGREAMESSFYGETTANFSGNAVDMVADDMAVRFAVAAGAGGAGSVLVRVDAIADYADYRSVLKFFETIELVGSAWPAYVEGDSVVFRLTAQADAEQLSRIIAINRRLKRLESPQPLERGPVDLALTYQWLQ
jgi:hypothetical protein